MADTKITALAAIGANPIIPSTFPIPMVDLTDTSMAASGTTKKVTVNQILQAGGTATLASATITGALGAAGLNVTGSTIPANGVYLGSANNLSFSAASTLEMTLNATGLGVGTTDTTNARFNVRAGTGATGNSAFFSNSDGTYNPYLQIQHSSAGIKLFVSSAYGTPSNNLIFGNGGVSETMRIDGSGQVGIGVTPSAWATYKGLQVGYASLAGYAGSDTLLGSNVYFDGGAFRYISTATASSYRQLSGVHQWNIAPSGTAGNPITFTQAMTLDASGNLLVGQTTAALDAQGGFYFRNAAASGGSSMIVNHRSAVTSGNSYAEFTYNGVGIGSITQSGTTGVAFNATSDYRLKEAVQPITGALSRISALKPSIYKWKVDGSSGEGFLAHELAEAVPLAVTGDKDAVNEDGSIKPQQVDLSKVVPVLVAAIQELTARVQTLEAK